MFKLRPFAMAYPESIQKLIDIFTKLPGIGPRQASRFVFFILKQKREFISDLIGGLQTLQNTVGFCTECSRSIEKNETLCCELCIRPRRDSAVIAIVEKESDMQNLEKTGEFPGLYHILGGVLNPLDSDSPQRLHLKNLYERIKGILLKEKRCEVVLATNPTTEGDMTALYIERVLAPLKESYPQLIMSRLGRGLSLGSELEHVDEMTLRSAFLNRK